MNRIINILSLLVFLLSYTFVSGQNKIEKIKTFLNDLEPEQFSGTILVAHKDSIIEKRAYGLASIEYKVKNKIDTKFNIASISKMITAVATLKLFEQDKIELNVPIKKYLPNYPKKIVRDSVTIHQLLSHTSGLNNFYVSYAEELSNTKYDSISDFVPLFSDEPLLSKPGVQYSYSASGYVILGLIIEEVSGQNYYDYVNDNVFIPSGMLNTSEHNVDDVISNKASGYSSMFGDAEILTKNDSYLSKASPGGFHYSTVEDLYNFSKKLTDGTLLKTETVELMFEPKVKGQNTYLGYGVDVDTRYNQTIQGQSGGWYGVHCELMDFTRDEYTVIVLSNVDCGLESGASKVINFFKEQIAGK